MTRPCRSLAFDEKSSGGGEGTERRREREGSRDSDDSVDKEAGSCDRHSCRTSGLKRRSCALLAFRRAKGRPCGRESSGAIGQETGRGGGKVSEKRRKERKNALIAHQWLSVLSPDFIRPPATSRSPSLLPRVPHQSTHERDLVRPGGARRSSTERDAVPSS
jgi:hypothetical protein